MMFQITYALLWLVAAILGLVLLATVRQLALLRGSGAGAPAIKFPALGQPAPDFAAVDLITGKLRSSAEFKGRRTVLCLVSADCGTCIELLSSLSKTRTQEASRVVVICKGSDGGCTAHLPSKGTSLPFLDGERLDLEELFGVQAFPTALLIDEGWRIVGVRAPSDASDVLESFLPREHDAPRALWIARG